jgi:hypothetical protein
MESVHSSETALTRAARRNIPEEDILHYQKFVTFVLVFDVFVGRPLVPGLMWFSSFVISDAQITKHEPTFRDEFCTTSYGMNA